MRKEIKNKAVPKLRFPEFNEIWGKVTLGKLGSFIGGGTPSRSNESYWQGNIPWISSSDISENSINQINISRFITEEALEDSATKLVPENSILLVSRVGVGKLAVTNEPVCTSQDFTNFTPHKDNLTFLAYYLKSHNNELLSFSQGMAIKGFTKEDIAKLILFIPAIAEQQKIADCLSSLDELITAENEKLEALKDHKKGLMQNLFPQEGKSVPKLRFPEFRDSGEWVEKKLGDITYKVSQKNKDGKKYPIYSINNNEGFLPQSDQFDGIDSNERGYDISMYKVIEKNTFAYNPARINIGSIGYSGELHNVIISSLYVCFKTKNTIHDRFLLYFLKSQNFNNSVRNTVEGGIRSYLFYENFSGINLFLPLKSEQQKIADCLSSLDELITAQSEKIEIIKEHKKGLMQGLFPG